MAVLLQIFMSIVVAIHTFYIAKFIRHRRFYAKLPGPPHSFLWGHLKLYGETLALFPPLGHFQTVITTIVHKHKLPVIFYLDLWPLAAYLDPIIGKGNIVAANGPRWKRLRDMLAPAFSAAKPVLLEHIISALAFDIIFKLIFGYPADAQAEKSADLRNLDAIIRREFAIRNSWNPLTKLRLRREKESAIKRLDKSIESKIRAWFDVVEHSGINVSNKRSLSIMDLIIREKILDAKARVIPARLDSDFLELAVNNIKTLLLAGSGTTTSTLCFAFMLLSIHPPVVYRLLSEHARIFSSDVEAIHKLLQNEPQRLKELEYTACIIKETLRIYPIGNSGRAPDDPGPITYKGKHYLTHANTLICPVQQAWQVSADVFPDPDSFNPDRFLDMDKTSMLAWQLFKRGNRVCIGQALAMEEMKTVLLYTVQFFQLTCHGLKPNSKPRVPWTWMDLVFGDRAFQELLTKARPRDGMPMSVTRALPS
ncbi:cytochrome P450 [Lentithecium fluviatile CBS 122367]|uniref:Cytochrome P450 n=1 Tax=Lentithecium fluviatile CBS 122367 TaxID=1168545 RepID=A0A6G1JEF4_9PLEO|nr:cytochrome P450 [Lentithecium fluviatile CBS 122367]